MIKRVIGDLGAILGDAQERGLVAQNVVHSLARKKHDRPSGGSARRLRSASISQPRTKSEQSWRHLKGRWRPLLYDRDLRRAAGFRTARIALGRRRPEEGRDSAYVSAPTASTYGAAEKRGRPAQRFRCRRSSSAPCGSGSWPARKASSTWCSRTAPAASRATPTSSIGP